MSSGRQLLEQVEQAAAEREAELAEGRLRDQHQGTSSWWSDPDAKASSDAVREPPGPVSEEQQEAARQVSSDPVERKWPGYADEIKRQNELRALREKHPEFVIAEPEPEA